MRRYFFPLLLLFIFGLSQAQELPYQLINADNLTELQIVAEFPCEGRFPTATFYEELLLTSCEIQRGQNYQVYSLSASEERLQFRGSSYTELLALADNAFLSVSQSDFVIYDAQGQEIIRQDRYLHSSLALSPDRTHLAFFAGSPLVEQESYDIFIYRLPDFELIAQSFSISGQVQNAKIALSNADSSLIAIAESGGRIQIFNWETGELTLEIADSPFITRAVGEYASDDFPTQYAWLAFSHDSSELFANQCTHLEMGCYEMGMTRFDSTTGELLASAEHPNNGEFFFAGFISESRLLLHSTGCETLNFYDMDSLNQLEFAMQFENCGGESYYAVNQAGTLIAVYDDPNARFLLYGIPSD